MRRDNEIISSGYGGYSFSELYGPFSSLVRIFELTIDGSQKKRFDSVGFHNLNTSVKTEPGTLAMYATHVKDEPGKSIILEIYQDQDAYQKHVASSQFGQYVE